MPRAAPYLMVWPQSLVLTLVPVGRVGRDLVMPVSWFQARDGEFALQGATKDAIKSMHPEHPSRCSRAHVWCEADRADRPFGPVCLRRCALQQTESADLVMCFR